MKLAVFLMMTSVALAAGWDAVQRVSPDHKVEVTTKGETTRGTFVSASETALVLGRSPVSNRFSEPMCESFR